MADMNVTIYPNTADEEDLADQAYDAIGDALWETVSEWSDLDSFSRAIDHSHPNLDDPDKSTFKSNFENWTWLNASGNGVHLAISSNFGGGLADSGEYVENAFVEETEAVVGSTTGGGDFFKSIAIQEAYHPFIDPTLSAVQNMTGSNNNEHSLGEVPSDNQVTPMVASYAYNGLDAKGDCDDNYAASGYSTSPTYCTNKAVYETFKDRV